MSSKSQSFPLHLVQLEDHDSRRVAVVDGVTLRLVQPGFQSIYALAQQALEANGPLTALILSNVSQETLDYDAVYSGVTPWRLLTPINHPLDQARCLVSGTGLTHLGSARDRQAMHALVESEMSDSMKMFQWGVASGRPGPGTMGTSPEWFYKGNGSILRSFGQPLEVPGFAEDGGEEAEIAGIYLVGGDGRVCRLGMAIGNEFSDHKFEKRNYLYLASSKIRTCSLGPELIVGGNFQTVKGRVSIERGGAVLWSKEIETGETAMCHSLANIEHHHFKFETHRRPGDLHVHYFGAHSLSFGAGVNLIDGDIMEVSFPDFGKALRNPLRVAPRSQELVKVAVAM